MTGRAPRGHAHGKAIGWPQGQSLPQPFRTLKGDLSLRPVYHQLAQRIEAHLFIAFLAYCLHTTLWQKLKAHASGLMPRAVLEKLATLQMLDVHIPVSTGEELILARHSDPSPEEAFLLDKLAIKLPAQPPPRLRKEGEIPAVM